MDNDMKKEAEIEVEMIESRYMIPIPELIEIHGDI